MSYAVKTKVNVLIPVFNEIDHIAKFLRSLKIQTLLVQPEYGVTLSFIDGASFDGTTEVLCSWIEETCEEVDAVLVLNEERYVAAGLNKVISASNHDVVVRMDVHAVYPPQYLALLCSFLLQNDHVGNVGCRVETLPNGTSITAHTIAAVCGHRYGVGSSFRSVKGDEVVYVDTVPFGCWRRKVFDEIGLFDERMLRNQDDELNWRLAKHGYQLALVPDITVSYFARANLRSHIKMFYQYGLFKPLTIINSSSVKSSRSFFPAGLILLIAVSCLMGIFNHYYFLLLPLLCVTYLLMSFFVFIEFNKMFSQFKMLPAIFMICITLILTHLSYGLGFLQGITNFIFSRTIRSVEASR